MLAIYFSFSFITMSKVQSHDLQQLYAANNKEEWEENDEAIFFIDCTDGYAVKNGTVKLLFKIELLKNGEPIALDEPVYIDPTIGAHGFIRFMRTAIRGGNPSEDLTDYAFVKMAKSIAVRDPAHDLFRSTSGLELTSPDAKQSQSLIMGTLHGCHGPDGVDFAPLDRQARQVILSPDFCLNNMITPIPYKETGSLEVRVGFAMSQQALWLPHGNAGNAIYSYRITDLEMQYVRVPDASPFNPNFPLLQIEKHNVLTPLLTLESTTPTFATAVSVVFHKHSQLFSASENSYMPHFIRGTKEVKYFFGNMDTSITAYHINDFNVLLEDYVASWMRKNKSTGFTATKRVESTGMGIGFAFNQSAVDISSSKLRIYAMLEDPEGVDTPSISNQYQASIILHSMGNLLA